LHDKKIRRRRAVLALLVVISLALLTDYFGERSSGPLHSVQRGIATVLSPLQSGASTVFSPFRDAAHYVSQTFNAKSQLTKYENEDHRLTLQVASLQQAVNRNAKAAAILNVDRSYNLSSYGPKSADVIGENPSLWYRTVTVDRGASSGVHQYDPVIGPGGLVGDVWRVNLDTSVVSLITSPNFAIGAEVQNDLGAPGVIQPQLGQPGTLVLNDLPQSAHISNDQLVVTNGFQDPKSPTIESVAPPGIPIGKVSSTNPQSSVLTNQQVTVTPLADLQYLSLVQILTRPHSHG
jgi:rod shape-determining protein MreC